MEQVWANNKIRLVLTGECNIGCFYCHNEGQPKTQTYFSKELFEYVLKLISDSSQRVSSVTFTGGEPLLHPDIESYIRRIKPYVSQVTIVTNGLLLSKERIQALKNAGLDKIRLGIDSIQRSKSRPTPGKISEVKITDVVDWLQNAGLNIEMNTVLTKFNESEISHLIEFCTDRLISAKFFEHVQVYEFGDATSQGKMSSMPAVSFDTFDAAAKKVLRNPVVAPAPYFGDSNIIYTGDEGISVTYCRYLCDYNLCYMTGTRIDPEGFVYVCMKQRGKYSISPSDHTEHVYALMKHIVSEGCGVQ